MLRDTDIQTMAAHLHEAERTRMQTRALSVLYPDATIDDAYRIQEAFVARKISAGAVVKGHKIGLTSKAMQAAVGINQPDSGYLLDDMFFADGGVVPKNRFIGLRVEAELAFILKADLASPDLTMFDVLNATDFVTPALEILDTRFFRLDPETKASRKVVDTIADNAANAGVVVGGRPFRPAEHDMRWIGAICSKNGAVEETGLAGGVLNNPANGIVWLARRLAGQGRGLKAGEIVLAGSFIRPIEVGSGDTLVADYGQFGAVSCYFE
jgi:2-oxo-hept-3-ene-1,7-dioate hydratase